MAANLIDAGHTLQVFDLNAVAVQDLVAKVSHAAHHSRSLLAPRVTCTRTTLPGPAHARRLTCTQGAKATGSPKEAAVGVDAIITMVPNDKVLRDVVCNPDTGLLDTLKGVHISCSTIHPDTARELATLHEANGSQYVGAPIFARADGVAARLASFVVGGAEAAVQRALPLLEANSNGIFRFGEDAGAGNVVKLCGNYMIASAIESCSEALSLAEKSGLDRQVPLLEADATDHATACTDGLARTAPPYLHQLPSTNCCSHLLALPPPPQHRTLPSAGGHDDAQHDDLRLPNLQRLRQPRRRTQPRARRVMSRVFAPV